MMTSALQLRWNSIVKLTSPEKQQRWFDKIIQHYAEPQRFYHTHTHIEELLGYCEEYKSDLVDPTVCEMAVWFHDVIYDPKRPDNEEKSAEMFLEFSQDWNESSERIAKVQHYIERTKDHKHDGSDKDLAFFLDFDVAILGRPPKVYQEYAANIRKEYIHVPWKDYQTGRTAVLKKLMAGGIFSTSAFKESMEAQAISNMEAEILHLQNQEHDE
eukprot:TRINITY_DN8991_c0_g1_i1.p1 TRINITY_DN8991_c0_g1~~TRINITY_DN8991_c0_g1_i1.p1  ORF type:complete len:214 (+),score=35.68 TRINITY_DN8991_c0_g1_i1:424-1065(+)